nr:MAG TPA: hypothetical protein [Caudoviricetes sp.]
MSIGGSTFQTARHPVVPDMIWRPLIIMFSTPM